MRNMAKTPKESKKKNQEKKRNETKDVMADVDLDMWEVRFIFLTFFNSKLIIIWFLNTFTLKRRKENSLQSALKYHYRVQTIPMPRLILFLKEEIGREDLIFSSHFLDTRSDWEMFGDFPIWPIIMVVVSYFLNEFPYHFRKKIFLNFKNRNFSIPSDTG